MATTRLAGITDAGFVLIAVSLGATSWSIFGSQVAFDVAAILWVIDLVRRRGQFSAPPFFMPLVAYAGLTLVSAVFSPDPRASLVDSRQLLLFLIVPVVSHFARGDRANRVLDVIIALGSAGALYGILQYAVLGYDSLSASPDSHGRPVGFLSHWMTFSGVLMLVTCASISRLLYVQKEWVWPAIAVPALVAALVLSLTRNAWLGTIAAVLVLFAIRNWRLLLVVPVAALIIVLVSPGAVLTRINSIGDTTDLANRDRLAMLRMGANMVKDHPLTGVGPEMIERVYVEYRDPMAVNPTNPHLHNVPMQIAAERGLPALAAWLWFVIVATRDLFRQLLTGPAKALSAAGLAAMISMFVAGQFEYNFGDSEFLMLFLGLITLPWAATRPELVDK
jgi:putative inorganic carbon (HCO3(-)) transporter